MLLYDKVKFIDTHINDEDVNVILKELQHRTSLSRIVGHGDILFIVPTLTYYADEAVKRLTREFPNGKYRRVNQTFNTGLDRVYIKTPREIMEGKIRGLMIKEVRWL